MTEAQRLWFIEDKPKEELFDTEADPHEIKDLSGSDKYAAIKSRLSAELDNWLGVIKDLYMIDEQDLISSFWPSGKKPVTKPVHFVEQEDFVILKTETEGASIGYRLVSEVDTEDTWMFILDLSLYLREKGL